MVLMSMGCFLFGGCGRECRNVCSRMGAGTLWNGDWVAGSRRRDQGRPQGDVEGMEPTWRGSAATHGTATDMGPERLLTL